MLDIFLEVKPTAKGRPRFAKNGNVYTPNKTSDAEAEIRLLLRLHMSKYNIKLTYRPVCVIANFYYLNKTISDGYKSTRPDIDNIFKLISDAMNGIVYSDDSQIVKMQSEKRYGARQGIELKVMEI